MNQSKHVLDPATGEYLPDISVSIKPGASDRTLTLSAATSLELRRYSIVSDITCYENLSKLISRQPPLGDDHRFSIYAAEFTENSYPMNSFFEQTLGQEQHINKDISMIGFSFRTTSITNTELVSPNDGNGVFAQVITLNPRVRSSNTITSIVQRLLNSLDAIMSSSQQNSLAQIGNYLQRLALYQRIEHKFPTAPIPVIIARSGTSTVFINLIGVSCDAPL